MSTILTSALVDFIKQDVSRIVPLVSLSVLHKALSPQIASHNIPRTFPASEKNRRLNLKMFQILLAAPTICFATSVTIKVESTVELRFFQETLQNINEKIGPYLKKLVIDQEEEVNDKAQQQQQQQQQETTNLLLDSECLSNFCSRLNSLDLSRLTSRNCFNISAASLISLTTNCGNNLRYLDLSYSNVQTIQFINDEFVKQLSENCHFIEYLDLTSLHSTSLATEEVENNNNNCCYITPKALTLIASSTSRMKNNLKHFGCSCFDQKASSSSSSDQTQNFDSALDELTKNCTNLVSLYLPINENSAAITDIGFFNIAHNMSHSLYSLDFAGISPNAVKTLGTKVCYQTLKFLELDISQWKKENQSQNDEALITFSESCGKSLNSFSLFNCRSECLSEDGMLQVVENFGENSLLESFIVVEFPVENQNILIRNNNNIFVVGNNNNNNNAASSSFVTDNVLRVLASKCSFLRRLHLINNNSITNRGIGFVSKFPLLQSLCLNSSKFVDDDGIITLFEMSFKQEKQEELKKNHHHPEHCYLRQSNLVNLELDNIKGISDKSIANIVAADCLPLLQNISLRNTSVTTVSCAKIASHCKLIERVAVSSKTVPTPFFGENNGWRDDDVIRARRVAREISSQS